MPLVAHVTSSQAKFKLVEGISLFQMIPIPSISVSTYVDARPTLHDVTSD